MAAVINGFDRAAARLELDAELPRRVGEVMTDLIRRVLDDLELTPEQRQTAREVVPRRLREMREALEAGSAR